MNQVTAWIDHLGRSRASSGLQAPSAWADVVARYLEALRLTHYAADTVHIRTLYLKYFVAWATARGLTTPAAVTRAALERYQLLALSLPQAHRHAAERVEPARPARR